MNDFPGARLSFDDMHPSPMHPRPVPYSQAGGHTYGPAQFPDPSPPEIPGVAEPEAAWLDTPPPPAKEGKKARTGKDYFDELVGAWDPSNDPRMRALEEAYRGIPDPRRMQPPRVMSTAGMMGPARNYFVDPSTGRTKEITRSGEQFEAFDQIKSQATDLYRQREEQRMQLLMQMQQEQQHAESLSRFGKAIAGAYGLDDATIEGLTEAQMKTVLGIESKKREGESRAEQLDRTQQQMVQLLEERFGVKISPRLEPGVVDQLAGYLEEDQQKISQLEEQALEEQRKAGLASGEMSIENLMALSPSGILAHRAGEQDRQRQAHMDQQKMAKEIDGIRTQGLGLAEKFGDSVVDAASSVFGERFTAPKLTTTGADGIETPQSKLAYEESRSEAVRDHNERKVIAFMTALSKIRNRGATSGAIMDGEWQQILAELDRKHSNAFGDLESQEQAFRTALSQGEPEESWSDATIERMLSDPEMLDDPETAKRIDAMTRDLQELLLSRVSSAVGQINAIR